MQKRSSPQGVTLIRATDARPSQWKNGGGTALEIAIHPAGASLENGDFLWRLSSATITGNEGSFSDFAGFERFFTLIEGRGLTLQIADGPRELAIVPRQVHRFSGSEKIRYALSEGPVKDLSLIFRPAVKASFDVLKISPKPRSFQLRARLALVCLLTGSVKASLYPGEHEAVLKAGDTLKIETALRATAARGEDQIILLEPTAPEVWVAAIELSY